MPPRPRCRVNTREWRLVALPLVFKKKVLFRRLRVYFIGIRSLFSFILLIIQHDYVMYWCGVHWVLCGRFGLFNFVIQTNEDEDNSDWMQSPVNFVDISHHFFYYNTSKQLTKLHYITENTIGSFIERAVISCNLVQLGHRAQPQSLQTAPFRSNVFNSYHMTSLVTMTMYITKSNSYFIM